MAGKKGRSGGHNYPKVTNAELLARVKTLEAQLMDAGIRPTARQEAEDKAAAELAEAKSQPTGYQKEEDAHSEYVAPFIAEWEAKLDIELKRLCQQWHDDHGGGILDSKSPSGYFTSGSVYGKLRQKAEDTVPYDGPERDYWRYTKAKENAAYDKDAALAELQKVYPNASYTGG